MECITFHIASFACPCHPEKLIVIDSDPFLVAAMDYRLLNTAGSSDVVALWSTGAIKGAAWQLKTGDRPFTLTVPPQGTVEEMAKDKNDGVGPDTPLKFSLSPPAPLTLKATYFAQNFAEAPEICAASLQPRAARRRVGVVSLNFELLYRLACTVDNPLLRPPKSSR